MKFPGRFLLLAAAAALPIFAEDANWPQFRGPKGNGISTSTGLPLTWSETDHIAWKTPIHGKAWSSPVVWGDQIWMTTASEDGRELSAVCVDRATGKILRDQKLFDIEKPQFAHKFNSYGSPTPVIEEGRVYIVFGSPGIACLDTATGKVLWERRDFVCNHYRGAGSSPILHGNLLFLNFDGSDHQFIVALDKHTGKTFWRDERSVDYQDLGPDGKPESEGDWRKAFATCEVATLDGQPTLLSQGAKAFYAYVPETGEELWRIEERTSHSGGTRPVVGHGLVFFPTGWSQGQILAVKPGKKGESLDVNATTKADTQLQVAWKTKRNVPKKPSLLLLDDLLYAIDDNGVATCTEAETGKVVWNERIGGNYSAAPIAADGRLYFCSEEGKTTVVALGREFKKLAENTLDDGFMASPAVTGKSLVLRTKTVLYRVE
ncbi:MAG TPA: PQQ-binding-like beta-propeller repeat protein [Candidatus Limnocylindria bacterium]|jgi:outer membrane protein assembly factor BamB|nr:PQQ-binding-like beta-propeller repeat protein [Candidatus Limnocylindria bacterium]